MLTALRVLLPFLLSGYDGRANVKRWRDRARIAYRFYQQWRRLHMTTELMNEAEEALHTARRSRVPQSVIDRAAQLSAPVAARFNEGKTEYHLVPREAIDAIAEVLNKGAEKYEDRNWELGGPLRNPFNSMMRHILAWTTGEDIDPESGKSHMAHILTNAAFIETYRRRGIGTDFRPGRV